MIVERIDFEASTPLPGSELRLVARPGMGVALLEQRCEPGVEVPLHVHPYGEILEVVAGEARITLGEETVTAGAGQMVLIPSGTRHGFASVGAAPLVVRGAIGGDELISDFGGPYWPAYHLSAATYVERAGQILLLKRGTGGAGAGLWWIPGGAVDYGERPEEGALRELREEAGLEPTGDLTLIGLFPQRVYGRNTYCATYACDCTVGDVVISNEHTGFRWIDPVEFRERFFADAIVDGLTDSALRQIVVDIRDDLDRYLAWRSSRRG